MSTTPTIFPKYIKIHELPSINLTEAFLIKHSETEDLFILKKTPAANPNIYKLLKTCDHLNISPIYEFKIKSGYTYTIEDIYDGESLAKKLKKAEDIDEGTLWDIISQITDALEWLHTQTPPIIYNNLEPKNIIISEENIVKLINFEKAETSENIQKDIYMLGKLMYGLPYKYLSKYNDIIQGCMTDGVYKTAADIRVEMGNRLNASKPLVKLALLIIPIALLLLTFKKLGGRLKIF